MLKIQETGSTSVESLILAQDKRWRRALPMRVERAWSETQVWGHGSGDRVRNTWVTYPGVGDTRPKGWLIPHGLPSLRRGQQSPWLVRASAGARQEGPAAYQLVGGVTASRGDDG